MNKQRDDEIPKTYQQDTAPETSHHLPFEEFLPLIGEFGSFQKIVYAMLSFAFVPMAFPTLIMFFAALKPAWRCTKDSTVCLSNATFDASDTSRCEMARSDWQFDRPTDFSIITQFDMGCEEEYLIHMSTSLMFLGWVIGAVVLGWLADNYGRKQIMFPSIAAVLSVGFLTAFAPNIQWLLVGRFIVGFFIPGTNVQIFIMLNELVGPSIRPAVGISLSGFFTIALVSMCLIAYLVPRWKVLFMCCTAPYLVVLTFWWFTPESPRWLASKNRLDEGMQILRRIAQWNGKTIPRDTFLKSEDTFPKSEVSSESSVDDRSVGLMDLDDRSAGPMDLFRTRSMATSTVIQGLCWFVTGMTYYGLSLASDDLGGDLYVNYVLTSVAEFPAHIVAIAVCNRWGRKPSTIYPCIASGVACVLIACFPSEGDLSLARKVFGMVGKFLSTMSFDSIYTWSVELYTTRVRASGMGYCQVKARLGAAAAPWVSKALKQLHPTLPFITMGALAVVAGVCLFWLPETKVKNYHPDDSKRGVISMDSVSRMSRMSSGRANNRVEPLTTGV